MGKPAGFPVLVGAALLPLPIPPRLSECVRSPRFGIVAVHLALLLACWSAPGLTRAQAATKVAPPPPSGSSGAGPVSKADLERAYDAVAASAKEADPVKSRALAATAVPILQSALERGPSDCGALAVTAEAQIRAGLAKDAVRTTALGVGNDCDVAAMLQLSAWSSEYDESGERRSPEADLAKAERLYVQAAELFAARPDGTDAVASCLANASELAELRSNHAAGADRALTALKGRPTGDIKTRLGLTFLRCQGRRTGEGDAIDMLSAYFDHDSLLGLMDIRIRQLNARLDKGHDDAVTLAAMGYYSLVTGLEEQTIWAGRYLGEAQALDPNLPDLWYLIGRVADFRTKLDEAKGAFRRQIAEHPGTPASRLAINDLAYLLATSSAPQAELVEALRLLEGELAKTPEEVAMIDTRGQLLIALGRKPEGLAALRRAQAMEPSPERAAQIELLVTAR